MTNNPSPCPSNPEILTAREVAAILRCSDQQVYNLARRGAIPAIRLGKLVRFSRTAINEFILSTTSTINVSN